MFFVSACSRVYKTGDNQALCLCSCVCVRACITTGMLCVVCACVCMEPVYMCRCLYRICVCTYLYMEYVYVRMCI